MTRVGCMSAVLVIAALIGVAGGIMIIPRDTRAAEGGRPPLTMEELEVRGYREKPDRLFLPVPPGIRHAAPVRYDLFREDVTKPIQPWEIDTRNTRTGGNRDNK